MIVILFITLKANREEMNNPLETKGILLRVDAEIIPLMDRYFKATGTNKKELAQQLLEFAEIFKYHYPECYKECQDLIRNRR